MFPIVFVTLCAFISSSVAQLNLLGLQLDLLNTKPTATTIKTTTTTTTAIPETCVASTTRLSSSVKICKGDLIFEDNFERPFLDRNLWEIEQYIPNTRGPDFEFVSYENSDDVLGLLRQSLVIKPIPREEESEIRGTLDLRDGCTSKFETECFHRQISSQIIPPVRSAKISTKFTFTYGIIEIKARLPLGDWIYPQIELVPKRQEERGLKIWIAYTRGNNHYIGRRDEGSRLLFGGIVFSSQQRQDRTRFTRTRADLPPYGNTTHTYKIIWQPDMVTLLFDGEEYGSVHIDEEDEKFFPLRREFYLTLGVGVGGVNDFPDSYTSNPKKPWVNFDSKQAKNFFDARNEWLPTWKHGNAVMRIDSVKIYAV